MVNVGNCIWSWRSYWIYSHKNGQLSFPQSLNPYIYVLNDPLRYTDPTGTESCDLWNVGCHAKNAVNSGVNLWNSQDQETKAAFILAVATVVILTISRNV
ncbi:hypothetical protein E6H16_04275 [Candidatus Bathyarchaeota archaeon]|nr:MAG: hypothetical protein E6H16_04275 [Candidatus Bathyarchaeota archaeon]